MIANKLQGKVWTSIHNFMMPIMLLESSQVPLALPLFSAIWCLYYTPLSSNSIKMIFNLSIGGHWYQLNPNRYLQFGVWWKRKLYYVKNSLIMIQHGHENSTAVEQLNNVLNDFEVTLRPGGHGVRPSLARQLWSSMPVGSALFCSSETFLVSQLQPRKSSLLWKRKCTPRARSELTYTDRNPYLCS